MSLLIDKQYINYIASHLERFKWIRGSSVALCKCPFCGDGRKGTRTRFYIYENVKYGSNSMNVDCKNCGEQMSFHSFLKDFDPGLFREYRLDCFRNKFGREPREMFAEQTQIEQPKVTHLDVDTLYGAVKLRELPVDHICRKYVAGRLIPDQFLDYLLYTDNFRESTAKFKDDDYAKKMPEDARLILPFYSQFGNLHCYQGRSLDPTNKMRYITVKAKDEYTKTFGLDRIDRSKEVRVCEGPIDSLFIQNSLASADADLTRVEGDVYVYDAQYRNKDVVRHINKAIDLGKNVVLFPKSFIFKDINEAVVDGGLNLAQIESIIKDNTFSGMKAKLVFGKLKGN